MRENKWYVEETRKLKLRVEAAYAAEPYRSYSELFDEIGTEAADNTFPDASDAIMRFVHLVYSYDANLPLNAELGQFIGMKFNVNHDEANKRELAKVMHCMDFFVEYLTDFAPEG